MLYDQPSSQVISLTAEILETEGVCFDPDNVTLQGRYSDELSAFRAKKVWIETLEDNFLLENKHDISVAISPDLENHVFTLTCTFLTACARYAFWRLTNSQAPEVQYIIETAHIPLCDSRHDDLLRAPDLRSIREEPVIWNNHRGSYRKKKNISSWLLDIIQRLSK